MNKFTLPGVFIILSGLTAISAFAQEFPVAATPPNLGIFENHGDIGDPSKKGGVVYLEEKQEYIISGSGSNMWDDQDEFHYLYRSIQGDFIVRAQLNFLGEGVDPHRKTGWVVRENLKGNAAHVNAAVHGDGLTSLQYRPTAGAATEEVKSTSVSPDVVQLERRGNSWFLSTARFGEPFTTVELKDVNLRNEVFVGLYISSHNSAVTEKAEFKNVRIIKPVGEDFQNYSEYLGSNLEIMNVETGNRKVLFHSAHSIQAPNWVNNDRDLVYNSNGYLYKYDLELGKVTQLETGFAVRNNNDHVFSFDEKLLGISHHNEADGDMSSIYLMDPEGDSFPTKITADGAGHSYLHGISPDNKTLLFTGHRNGKYDIYSIDVDTKIEKQLTHTDSLDDGSEFSPDGKYIYFNSNRTGKMHLYRMKPDGSEVKQLTSDPNHNDWFPHISPDGKWIVFISFPPEVPSGDHPFYKQCLLRLMPAEGGKTRIIGYIYGGQGSINVPSWSKDSRHIAFVSNSN